MATMTETVTVDGEATPVQTDYSQEDCVASALFYLIKSVEYDGGLTPEGATSLQAAKDWTNAVNPERYDFAKSDPTVASAPKSQATEEAPAPPARVPVQLPGQSA